MRRRKETTFEETFAGVKNGSRIAIGGFQLSSRPMALLRFLMKSHVTELTVISPPSGLDVDMLIAAGVVKKLITSYVGGETIAGIGPAYRRAVERNELEIKEYDTGMLIAALRAASEGLRRTSHIKPQLLYDRHPASSQRIHTSSQRMA